VTADAPSQRPDGPPGAAAPGAPPPAATTAGAPPPRAAAPATPPAPPIGPAGPPPGNAPSGPAAAPLAPPPGAAPFGSPAAPVSPAGVVEPRKRLHPLSPLLHGAKSIVVIIVALSWQTLSQIGLERFALVVAVLAIGVVIFSVINWLNTGYHVVGKELRIQDGLLWRRNRAIPLERLQAVELRRPLLAQLTGLAELRLEVVGGGKTRRRWRI
jgi:putative membrane protein